VIDPSDFKIYLLCFVDASFQTKQNNNNFIKQIARFDSELKKKKYMFATDLKFKSYEDYNYWDAFG
jgi:hypothetical protein